MSDEPVTPPESQAAQAGFATNCPDHPDVDYEMGFGLAGGGYGAYAFCPVCSRIIQKWQENDQ